MSVGRGAGTGWPLVHLAPCMFDVLILTGPEVTDARALALGGGASNLLEYCVGTNAGRAGHVLTEECK
jgi:hypothetical protein